MVVTNILEMKAYGLADEEKVPLTKNCLGGEGLQPIKSFTMKKKNNARLVKIHFNTKAEIQAMPQ